MIYKCECECGYRQSLYLGIGTLSEDRNTVLEMYDENIVQRFESFCKSETTRRWYMYNAPITCEKCKTLFSAPVLVFEYDDNVKSELWSRCPKCKSKCEKIVELENAACPECGKALAFNRVGHWS